MDYNRLIEKIAGQPELQNEIDNMVQTYGALNLVVTDWKETLHKNDLYKKYEANKVKLSKPKTKPHNISVKSIVGYENQFHVILAGYWSLGRRGDEDDTSEETVVPKTKKRKLAADPDSLVSRYCPPLAEIGRVIKYDNSDNVLFENCKLFINTCSQDACSTCAHHKKDRSKEFNDANNWCIRSCRIYDGSRVGGRFKCQIVDSFNNSNFLGVIRIQINQVFSFGQGYKISGNIANMILFKDQNLEKSERIEETLPPIPLVPSILYEEEEEGEVVTCVRDTTVM